MKSGQNQYQPRWCQPFVPNRSQQRITANNSEMQLSANHNGWQIGWQRIGPELQR